MSPRRGWRRRGRARDGAHPPQLLQEEWERGAVFDYLATMERTEPGNPIFPALAALLRAGSTREVLAAVRGEPELLGDRAQAGLRLLELHATMIGAPMMLRVIRQRTAWLEFLRNAGTDPARMRLPDE
ncbi:hypothetical protein [Streptomyces phaeochromogenes]|uniref:hypothetical protein n=1 Tax=Streptomyces phaeochromogenes TaxID=1923 RepID=UPI000B0971A0|nr:hypothetical protein [Streptomyces phaeochromogenes]